MALGAALGSTIKSSLDGKSRYQICELQESSGALNFEREDGIHDRRAPVHVKDLACHPARFFHTDEHYGVGDVLWCSRSPGENLPFSTKCNVCVRLR